MIKSDGSATEMLRREILGGSFAPGERLTEISLAQRYGVGRGAIRAALIELRGEGLVDIAANRGAVVRRISLDEAIEIAEARQVLEALIAGRAARHESAPARESLGETLSEMRRAVGDGDHGRYSALNRSLHQRIWDLGAHRVAHDLVANLRDRSAHHQYRLAVMPGRAEESLEQHRAIVEAIVAGDAAAAETAMSEHLASVVAVLHRWADLGVTV